ncbi:MAG: tetratricopeptide repeat protein [Terriglobales bacterium]
MNNLAVVAPRASSRVSKPLLAAVLAASSVAYLWTLHFGFVYDDLGQIVANPLIQSWKFLPQYFHGNVWMQQSALGNYFRPLFLVWLLLNHTLFGLHPAFWHLSTVAVHLGATALVYLLALRLSGRQKVAAIAAVIFGVHPAHVESVAWISGVTDALLALLLIPSFLAFMNYREKKGAKWLGISVAFYALALLAKETAVVLPVFVFLYVIFWPDASWKRKFADAFLLAVPYALVTVPYLLLRASALHGVAHRTVDIPLSISFYTMPSVLWFYVRHLLAPLRLSAFYDTPYITHVSWKYFLAPLTAMVVTLAVIAAAWWKSRSPLVAFAAAWIFVPLLPVLDLSLLPMGDFVHDRYLYLPLIGFALLAGLAFEALDRRKLAGVPLGTTAVIVIVIALTAGTIAQSLPWRDDIPLYQHGMRIAPLNDLPRNKLAATYVARGMYEQGIDAYKFVLANDPEYWYANYRMGYAQHMLGRYDAAQSFLEKAATENGAPDVLYYLGLNATKLKRYEMAEQALARAIERNPQAPGYEFALGVALKEDGKLDPALQIFLSELKRDPNDAGARAQVEELTARLHPAKK